MLSEKAIADSVVQYLKDTLLEHGLQIAALTTLSNIGKADLQKELSQWEQQNELQDHDDASFLLSSVHPFIEAILNNLSERFPTWDIDILSSGEMFDQEIYQVLQQSAICMEGTR